MTDISPARLTQLERDRRDSGQFGNKSQSDPEALLANVPASAEETAYTIYANGEMVYQGAVGAGMADALTHARAHANARNDKPQVIIRASAGEGRGVAEVALPFGDQGRIVGWYNGDARTAEELDEHGLSLSELSEPKVEPFLELDQYGETEIPALEQVAHDGDYNVISTRATRDEDTGGRHIDVDVSENFLWNAESRFPDDEAEEGDHRNPQQRYEAWLDANSDIVRGVYQEWFNAELDIPDTWEYVTVSMRTTVPYERFTESLVIEDVYPLLAKHRNETDPGTFGSEYVMNEVYRRVDAKARELDARAEESDLPDTL